MESGIIVSMPQLTITQCQVSRKGHPGRSTLIFRMYHSRWAGSSYLTNFVNTRQIWLTWGISEESISTRCLNNCASPDRKFEQTHQWMKSFLHHIINKAFWRLSILAYKAFADRFRDQHCTQAVSHSSLHSLIHSYREIAFCMLHSRL